MLNQEQLFNRLKQASFDFRETDSRVLGYSMEVLTTPSRIRAFASIMYDLEFYPVFITAVHVTPCLQIVYQFASIDTALRIMARLSSGEDNSVPTISDILQGANWHEREVRDLFGIRFENHPDLNPLILPEEDAGLEPLRKRDGEIKNIKDVFRQTDDCG